MQVIIGGNGNDKPEELFYFVIKTKSLRFNSTYFNINKVDVIFFESLLVNYDNIKNISDYIINIDN
ncbi:hypothetical protein ARAF_1444 [Arsenophonus endosymbiont of Aleurodicus floccissimus]|uniref:hypothetical protein n=1 Tax=Arsenophonus endosymbiont of Aleurodicus floccissimus TaxID=2152761 RepID=UPI000E6AF0A7|nr:hypothetical protein [Arsenophonus endosymbiont of Aleurodicus floccissimus]SPP31786.1 hypothetical protein ARAF_1444 [Arsenophonus endosymbiont of Aleurodicus floccissimus]